MPLASLRWPWLLSPSARQALTVGRDLAGPLLGRQRGKPKGDLPRAHDQTKFRRGHPPTHQTYYSAGRVLG
eukprot:13138378-Alexandrium_andersonii.AAC.1